MNSHKTNNTNLFNEAYYENGVKAGISGYENYKWIPTRSIPEAISISEMINFESAMDFGCAKGFLVHALSLLNHDKPITGVDISEYAITHCLPQVKDQIHFLDKPLSEMGIKTDLLIAKDVLEHIPEEDIDNVLAEFYKVCNQAFLVIPLGDNDSFRIREYEMDKTHVTKKDEEWWISKINKAGFKLKSFNYHMGDIKEKWTTIPQYKYGNGFFIINK
jgi:trans-aconitate methyltransferase